jgi:hypothetical protein
MESKDLEARLSHVELKYKTDTAQLKDQVEFEKVRGQEAHREVERLREVIREHERVYHLKIDEFNKCKHSHTESEI